VSGLAHNCAGSSSTAPKGKEKVVKDMPHKLMADAQKSYYKTADVSREDLSTFNSEEDRVQGQFGGQYS
jgi:hypothetical protein